MTFAAVYPTFPFALSLQPLPEEAVLLGEHQSQKAEDSIGRPLPPAAVTALLGLISSLARRIECLEGEVQRMKAVAEAVSMQQYAFAFQP